MKTETTQRGQGLPLPRLVRQFGPEVCWLGMIGMILLANTKAAGVTAMIGCAFAWALGFLTARICKPNVEALATRYRERRAATGLSVVVTRFISTRVE